MQCCGRIGDTVPACFHFSKLYIEENNFKQKFILSANPANTSIFLSINRTYFVMWECVLIRLLIGHGKVIYLYVVFCVLQMEVRETS